MDVVDVDGLDTKNLIDMTGDDLEHLAAELNSDRLSNSSNKESIVIYL